MYSWDGMEEIALGEMGMPLADLENITPRALFNKIRGFNNLQIQNWERTRLLAYKMLTPHFKEDQQVTPQQVMPFPWDVQTAPKSKEVSKEKIEAAKKVFDLIDAQKIVG